jgi:hypothetical protein
MLESPARCRRVPDTRSQPRIDLRLSTRYLLSRCSACNASSAAGHCRGTSSRRMPKCCHGARLPAHSRWFQRPVRSVHAAGEDIHSVMSGRSIPATEPRYCLRIREFKHPATAHRAQKENSLKTAMPKIRLRRTYPACATARRSFTVRCRRCPCQVARHPPDRIAVPAGNFRTSSATPSVARLHLPDDTVALPEPQRPSEAPLYGSLRRVFQIITTSEHQCNPKPGVTVPVGT